MGFVRVQPFYFQLHLPCAEGSVDAAEWMNAVSQCICVCLSFNAQRVSTERDCVVGLRGDGGLRRLSHGYNFSLVEQWLELTAVPVTRLPPSSDALCHAPCGGLLMEKNLQAFQKCCWRAVAIFCTVQCNLISSCFYIVKRRQQSKNLFYCLEIFLCNWEYFEFIVERISDTINSNTV